MPLFGRAEMTRASHCVPTSNLRASVLGLTGTWEVIRLHIRKDEILGSFAHQIYIYHRMSFIRHQLTALVQQHDNKA